jgi:NAD(P)-dependent dehydrogenase (short-subunit alcohol dehydrogenase family)
MLWSVSKASGTATDRFADLAIDVVRAAFDEVMQVNVLGYILSAKIFRESLAKRKGAIVLTASSNASIAADGGGIFYTASKHAVAGVTRQLAFEFGPNVRVNAVAPAGIALSDLRGPRAAGLDSESQNDAPKDMFLTAFRKLTLLDHMPSGEEYGPLYALLAAPGARIMTGDIVMADQGLWNRPLISANR